MQSTIANQHELVQEYSLSLNKILAASIDERTTQRGTVVG